MSIGLRNTKLSVPHTRYRNKRVKKAAPSIAEKAIFIPKPKKRVKFTLNTTPGRRKTHSALPALGEHGITASLQKKQYRQGAPAQGYVNVEIVTPEKDFSVIPTQEEGRQINHHQIHFTQQYDSYGRPRIGFSREPYDFAATKYIQVTNSMQFQENVVKTRDRFDQHLFGVPAAGEKQVSAIPLPGKETTSDDRPKVGFSGEEPEVKVEFFGEDPEGSKGSGDIDSLDTLGDEPLNATGEGDTKDTDKSAKFDKFFFRTDTSGETEKKEQAGEGGESHERISIKV